MSRGRREQIRYNTCQQSRAGNLVRSLDGNFVRQALRVWCAVRPRASGRLPAVVMVGEIVARSPAPLFDGAAL
jgi:hypothetical protein